jgi:hypothetical protein
MAEESSSDKPKLAGRLVALVLIDLGHEPSPVQFHRSRETARDVFWPRSRSLEVDESPLRPF